MEKHEFDNPLRQQCMSLPELCDEQIEGVKRGLKDAVPDDILRNIRRVILTGCGDSYVAALAAVPAFRKFAGRFGNDFRYARAIDVARYESFDLRYSENTLVVGVSCSGGPARIQEVLRRANHYGCVTLALTNNPDSPAAQEAKYSLIVHTPAFPKANPGLRNYFASLTGLYMLAAKLGIVIGCSSPSVMDELTDAMRKYTAAWFERLENIDEQMFVLAQQWKDFKSYDYIGDDIQFATAFFMGAKMVEVAGKMTSTDDSEDWCHVGFFQKNPCSVGTVVVVDKKANNKSRICETISQAVSVGRPLLVIANGARDDFQLPEQVEFCNVPETSEGFEFLLPLMNYIPGAILAGYVSMLTDEPFFRGGGVWAFPGNNTIRSSTIEVI